MANGKIKADTLEHSTAGSLDTSYVVNGSAKAWAHIAAGGASLPDSFNFSSIDDDGNGEYGLNYISVMGSTNYSANMTLTFNHAATSNARDCIIEAKTASSVEVDSGYVAGSTTYFTPYDIETNASVTVQGDLA
jgi:hypothetical protein